MALLSVVVVPAHDEERTISLCLAALAGQTVSANDFEVIVVADACSDNTAGVAKTTAERLGLRLELLTGPGAGSGPARRLGMDAAADRLASLGRDDGLIATTDADSTPAPDWLARQLDHVARGASVIAGLIDLDQEETSSLPSGVLRRRQADARRRMAQLTQFEPHAGHHHFAGASLGVTVRAYQSVGGLEPTTALEDEAFSARLRRHGIPVLHAADVVARTSARLDGRARRGLSVDLSVSIWSEQRRFAAADFSLEELRQLKGTTSVSVVIPTRACGSTIAGVLGETVAPHRAAGLLDEVIVIDAERSDGTAEIATAFGARVVAQDTVMPEHGPALGKGDAMWRRCPSAQARSSASSTATPTIPMQITSEDCSDHCCANLSIALVKGAFDRPFRTHRDTIANEGGRVTELAARPLLNLHVPLLAGFTQPLAGEFAGRRDLLERVPFPVGYGVEIGVLIDALREVGLSGLAECHLGTRQNRHQPLRALGEMAFAALAAVENRLDGPRSATAGHYLKPWDDGAVVRVPIAERPPLRSILQPPLE